MAYERKCPYCGVNLDPCEKCDCDNVIPFADAENAENEAESSRNEVLYNEQIDP